MLEFDRTSPTNHRCLRAMCRVNRRHTHEHRISNDTLMERLSLKSIDTYICKQQLRWAGHVVRMPWSYTVTKKDVIFMGTIKETQRSTSIHLWTDA